MKILLDDQTHDAVFSRLGATGTWDRNKTEVPAVNLVL